MTAHKMQTATLVAATAFSLALSISPLLTTPVFAQWIVYDPTNFSQNVLTAARELQQINNQIQMLNNQAQSLVNQGKNLANLPLSTLTQLQAQVARTQSLLSQAQNIAFSVERIQTAYSTTYGTAAATGSNATMFAAAQTRWQNSVGAFEDSLKRSCSSSWSIPHMFELPGRVWIMALPTLPSAHPMPMFLFEPPKPPI